MARKDQFLSHTTFFLPYEFYGDVYTNEVLESELHDARRTAYDVLDYFYMYKLDSNIDSSVSYITFSESPKNEVKLMAISCQI